MRHARSSADADAGPANGARASADADAATDAVRLLDGARDGYWEDPAGALEAAARALEAARTLQRDDLRARALSVQGTVILHRGDLRGAHGLAVAADASAARSGAAAARLEVAALRAQLSFFSGAYGEALRHATATIDLADGTGEDELRMFARRAACVVLGNLDAPGWRAELDELVRLSVVLGHRWQEAISRNDLAQYHMDHGDPDAAERELDRALALAEGCAPANALALAVVHCTRAELRMRAGRPADALADAERALERLADNVPQARSMILESVARALRGAGRTEEAFDALARGAQLEREALRELTELQVGLERATLQAQATRHEADALAAKNRELQAVLDQLALVNAELELRGHELESAQALLREQVDRDSLTGLHNRRYLALAYAEHEAALAADPGSAEPCSIAALDLDGFKAVNDALGHRAGDQVLVRVAALLRAVVRASDVIARTGGEEFVVLMPGTDADAAVAVCRRLLAALRAESWQRIGPGLRVTASAGVACTGVDGAAVPAGTGLEGLAALADARLYEAKRSGRDRVVGV